MKSKKNRISKEIKVPAHSVKDVNKEKKKQLQALIKKRLEEQDRIRKIENNRRKWSVFLLYVALSVVLLIIIFLLISFVFSDNTNASDNQLLIITNIGNYTKVHNQLDQLVSNNEFNITAFNKLKSMPSSKIKSMFGINKSFCIVLNYKNGSIVEDSNGNLIRLCVK